MICYVLFLFSVLVSVTDGGRGANAAYEPTDVFLINCGANSTTNDTGGRIWKPEQRNILSSNFVNASFSSDALHQESGLPQVPYMKARIFRFEFTYRFPVSPGWKFLRLYFYPTRYEYGFDAAKSNFSVIVNGFTLLRNFSANLTVNASKPEYLMKEFIVPVDQTLDLKFRPSPNSSAFVNGIEIVSMPDGLYSKGGFDDVITNAGGPVNSQIDNSTAFETVYRLNIGGQKIAEVGDSGMFRRWISDDEFLLGANSYLLVGERPMFPTLPDVKINYTEKTPAYVAPEDVYATCRSMGNVDNPELNLNFDMTWLFTIDAGFNYLVRLHFCETLPQVNEPDQQVFSIFIENQMAKKEMDVIRLSGGPRVPIYLDFSLNVGSKIGLKHDIRLDLHPLPNATPKYYNAILNGVEILKLNNSDGNLAGPNPNGSNPPIFMDIASNTVKGESNVLAITLIVVGSAIGLATFISVIMLSMRQMKTKKNRKEKSVVMFKVLLKQYTYAELKKITKSFSHTIGKGGFGIVYGGNLCNGRRKVAVKVLKASNGNGEDFINEVASMSQTSHVNIVSLLVFAMKCQKERLCMNFWRMGL